MAYPNIFANQTGPLALSLLDANFAFAIDIQSQAITVNAGGSADAITATYVPAVTALVNGLTLYVKAASANTTTTPQFSPNGLTGHTIVKGNNLALVAGDIAGAGHWLQLTYDSNLTAWVLGNPATGITPPSSIPIRQMVLSGPVDASGLSNFGGSTGSTTVTASGTLISTSSNGFSSSGNVDRVGSIVNPSWTGLSTNGSMYLYLDIASNGVCTTGSTTLAPVYQWGGTYSTTNGQFTFNIQAMVGQVGNGATAAQAYRVFVGEVLVAANVVSTITWYQLMGRYDSGFTATLPGIGVKTSKNHNLGIKPGIWDIVFECTTGDNGYAVGEQITKSTINSNDGTAARSLGAAVSTNTMFFQAGSTVAFQSSTAGTGAFATLTAASWKYKTTAQRAW